VSDTLMVSPLNRHLPSAICRAMRLTCDWLIGRLYLLCSSSSVARSGVSVMVSSRRAGLLALFVSGFVGGTSVIVSTPRIAKLLQPLDALVDAAIDDAALILAARHLRHLVRQRQAAEQLKRVAELTPDLGVHPPRLGALGFGIGEAPAGRHLVAQRLPDG